MRRLALTLILLFAAPVAAQEAGEPQAGAAYAKQYCGSQIAIDITPEFGSPGPPPLQRRKGYNDGHGKHQGADPIRYP